MHLIDENRRRTNLRDRSAECARSMLLQRAGRWHINVPYAAHVPTVAARPTTAYAVHVPTAVVRPTIAFAATLLRAACGAGKLTETVLHAALFVVDAEAYIDSGATITGASYRVRDGLPRIVDLFGLLGSCSTVGGRTSDVPWHSLKHLVATVCNVAPAFTLANRAETLARVRDNIGVVIAATNDEPIDMNLAIQSLADPDPWLNEQPTDAEKHYFDDPDEEPVDRW